MFYVDLVGHSQKYVPLQVSTHITRNLKLIAGANLLPLASREITEDTFKTGTGSRGFTVPYIVLCHVRNEIEAFVSGVWIAICELRRPRGSALHCRYGCGQEYGLRK